MCRTNRKGLHVATNDQSRVFGVTPPRTPSEPRQIYEPTSPNPIFVSQGPKSARCGNGGQCGRPSHTQWCQTKVQVLRSTPLSTSSTALAVQRNSRTFDLPRTLDERLSRLVGTSVGVRRLGESVVSSLGRPPANRRLSELAPRRTSLWSIQTTRSGPADHGRGKVRDERYDFKVVRLHRFPTAGFGLLL